MRTSTRQSGVLAWFAVVLVGVLVLLLVFGLNLFSRLDDGQQVLDHASPAFATSRAKADPDAIAMVSNVVDLADPVMEPSGGAAGDISNLVGFLHRQTGKSKAAITASLSRRFPHATALLEAVPLSSVTAELPGFLTYVGTLLGMTRSQVEAILPVAFPALATSVAALTPETKDWDNPPGMAGLTSFSGAPLRTFPQAQAYLQGQVVPTVPAEAANFHRLKDDWPPVHLIPWILTVVGAVVILFGLAMMTRSRRRARSRAEGTAAWSVVGLVGVLVLVLVFAFDLYPRLDGGNKLIRKLDPVFAADRVAGDRAAVNVISTSVKLLNPVMNPAGGATTEIANLMGFLSRQTGHSKAAVVADLQRRFPHVTDLLEAVPFTSVTSEVPGLLSYVGSLLGMTRAQVDSILPVAFPHLAQAVTYLPKVTSGWDAVPGVAGLTEFGGTPVTTVAQVRDYFSGDVIPVLQVTQHDFATLSGTSPPVSWFPTLLTIVGLLALAYALAMIVLVRLVEPPGGRRRSAAAT